MKETLLAVIVGAAAVVVMMGVFLVTPALAPQSAKQRDEVERLVTKGERLLQSYTQGFTVMQAVEAKLASLGAPANVGQDDDLTHTIESGKLVEQIAATIREINRALTSGSGRPPPDRVERLAEMGYPELLVETWFSQAAALGRLEARYLQEEYGQQWTEHLRPSPDIGMGASRQAEAIRNVWNELKGLRTANAAVLDGAETMAREALGVLADDIRANRLMGTVLAHKAMLKRREAALKAGLATGLQDAVIDLAGRVAELLSVDENYGQRRRLEASIEEAIARHAELQALLAEASAEHQRLAAELETARAKVSAALAEVQDARAALDALTSGGYDGDRHGPFASYVRSVEAASVAWRRKAAAYQAVHEGTVANAGLAPGADPLTSPYEPLDPGQPMEVRTGVATIERDVAIAADRVELLTAQLQRAEAHVTALEELKQALDTASAERRRQISGLRAELQARVDEEDRLSAEARRAEEEAIETLAASAKGYFKEAASGAIARMRGGLGVADEATAERQRYYRALNAAFIADEAGVLLLEAAVWLQRAQDLEARLPAIVWAAEAGVRELDPEALEVRLDEAYQAGRASAEAAIELATEARSQDDQWYHEALVGAGHYMKWLFAPSDAESLEEAIRAFEDAVTGREQERYAAPYLRLLAGLKATEGGPKAPDPL